MILIPFLLFFAFLALAAGLRASPVKAHLRVAVAPRIGKREPGHAAYLGTLGFLQNDDGTRHQPFSFHEAGQRLLAQALAIGRIGKDEIEGALRRAGTKPGGIAAPDLAEADRAQHVGIAADDAAGFGPFVDELAKARAARQGLKTQSTRSGKKSEDACAFDVEAFHAMGEDVENRLAHAVGRWARRRGGRTGDGVAFEFAAYDPHDASLALAAAMRSSGTMKQKLPDPMRLAIAEAHAAAARGEVPVGAALVADDGEVLAVAGNRTLELKDPTAHAEMIVIREAARKLGSERLIGCDLHVTLEPCAMCAAAISFARIRRLYFGVGDEKMGAVENGPRFFNRPTCHHRPEVYGGIGEREARELLTAFFKERRRDTPE